jgi:hypothetical protein
MRELTPVSTGVYVESLRGLSSKVTSQPPGKPETYSHRADEPPGGTTLLHAASRFPIAAARLSTVRARSTTGTSIIAPSNCTAPSPRA